MTTSSESTGVKRRDFLKILGVAGATTAVAGCNEPNGHLIPYVYSPDNTVPGVSTYYATTCRECAVGCGVFAETRDGRVIKLEGNPSHPVNQGALCARGQAAVQGLYNPDRYRGPMMRNPGTKQLEPTTWDKALQLLAQKLGEAKSRGGNSVAFVNQHETGSFPAFLDQWLAAFGFPAHVSYDAEADVASMMAHTTAYGAAMPMFDFAAARLIVSFGADFLDGWGASVPNQLSFADARARGPNAPRVIYVGARRSLTGLNADEWIPARAGSEQAILDALAGKGSLDAAARAADVPVASLQRLQKELQLAKPSLVLASASTANAMETAASAAALNAALGNVGSTIRRDRAFTGFEGAAGHGAMRDLATRMQGGGVSMLMVRGANPAFTTPAALGFSAAMAKVGFKVSFSSYPDETTTQCDLVLPDHHSLESWGDAAPMPNVLSLQQPAMDPVFDTRATADVLIAAAKKDPNAVAKYAFADYRSWLMSRYPGGEAGMTAALTKGFAAGTPLARSASAPAAAAAPSAPALESTKGDYTLVVYPSPALGDGRGANKPWLQELPDPVTKIMWQSVIELHPITAEKLGVVAGDLLTVTTAQGSVTAPAYPYLGVRQDTIAIALGRGHGSKDPFKGGIGAPPHMRAYGRYADGNGVNPLDLLALAEAGTTGGFVYTSTRASVKKTGDDVRLVTNEGSARQHGRGIGQAVQVHDLGNGTFSVAAASGTENVEAIAPQGGEGDADENHMAGDASHAFLPGMRSPVAADAQGELGSPTAADHGKDKGMYAPDHWSGMAKRRWAMTIDLARCTGCSACMTACYAENNIPTVGGAWQSGTFMPDRTGFGANITRSREMTWIRLERYYEGGEDGGPDFDTRFVPMLCQHCGNAPCEPVCPVYATYHSPDGLNVQVYNRCVGTRYCSNNCPYKVRYFNWFGYGEEHRPQYAFPAPLHMQLNPDVTVRGKGVMEKCTFCVQRIREAENRATLEHRELVPDEFTVACAQACPSRAITFGDAADERWSVTQLAKDARAYHVFEELNTYTAVVYLKKVNHPSPVMPANG